MMRRTTIVLMVALAVSLSLDAQPRPLQLAVVNVDGTRKTLAELPPSVFAPRLSPDGQRIAFETREPSGPDGARIWVAEYADVAKRRALPMTLGPTNWAPMWTPDGERLVFLVSGERPDAVYWRRADGSGDAEHLVEARSAEGWMARGTQMRFLTLRANRDYGISVLDIKTRMATTLIDLPGSAQHSSAVSPDGRWMAYASNETGRYEVWLAPLPPTGARYQLTRAGGSHPLWLPDGRSLYFDRGSQMFQLTVNVAAPSSSVEPVALPIKGFLQGEYRRQFDLLPNGRQFLMLFPAQN
jgi:eukaryotic-like serine/threonine-protein kinase